MNIQTLCKRAAILIERGKIREVIDLLNNFGVRAVVHLKPADYRAFSDGLDQIA